MNFSRKTILVVGAALLAACGDKVSVQEYTPPATVAKVNSVEVAPATASMLVGETATFTAAVNADAGLATTVTWTSSDASKASVSATGVVTAVAATPGVAICAASTVDTGKKGCATVAVRVATATGLTVAPSSATLNIGNTLQLTAAVSGATATPTWTSSSAAVTVSSAGLVTAVAATPGAAVCASAAGYTACSTIIVNGITITGVSIVPSSATLYPGETVQLNASIAGSNGATNTFSWAAGDANVTVSATGLVTAGATPATSSVCATSTQDATKRACAQITIVARPVMTPASVSINKVTATGNTAGTVNPAAVAGNIDVTLDVSAGSYTVSKVELLVGGVVAGSQTFSTAQAAALRYAAEQTIAAQAALPQIVFTVNTAAFNATTGVPSWANGAQSVQAKIYTTAGGATSAASASASLNLTFANVNTFAATSSVANTATANSAAGFTYTKGDLSISLIPVSYTGAVLASVNVNFGTAACDGSLTAQRTKALTAPAAGSAAWTGSLVVDAAPGAGDITSYEFVQAGGCPAGTINTGERWSVIGAQDNTGAQWVAGLPLNVGSFYRIDNLAPSIPGLAFTIATRRNAGNWVNDLPAFNNTAANGGAIAVASVDAGVGISTTPTNVYATTVATFGVLTNAATLAESATNATYSATAKGADLLGNTSAASGAATFGVDRSAPTFTHVLPADQSAIAAPGGVATGAFTYSDPAVVPAGPSTPSATPVRMTVSKRTTATATAYTTGAAWGAAGGAATSYNIGLAGGNIDAVGTNSQGYYIVSMFVEDGAANASASVSRSYLYDITAPTGPFTIPVMTASAGQSNLFSSTLTDNIDIASSQWAVGYTPLTAAPGAAGATIVLPATTFGSWQSFTLTGTDALNYPLYRSMTGVAAGVPVFPGSVLQTVAHQTADRAGLLQTFAATSVAIPAVNLPTMAVADPYLAAGFAGTGFSVTNAAVTVDISGNGVLPIVNTVDLTATAVGTVNTMPNPFTRVEFFVYDGVSNTYRYLGAASTPTVVDNVANRVYTWTLNWNPDAVGAYNNPVVAGAQNIVAIGVNATHDAVRSAANVNITTAP